MTTQQHQTISADDRMNRQEMQLDDESDDRDDRDTDIHDAVDVRAVRDEDIIEAKGETIAEREKPLITPPLPSERANAEAEPEPEKSVAKVQSTAPAAGQAVPNAGFGTPDVPGHDDAQASERWHHIQAEFVDDPRKAVGEAHQLVGDLVQRIVDAFAKERNELEQQWSKGDSVSTEDLRVCLQHYRAFFSRLLPSANGTQHS